jgi:hypothetical protein
MIRRLLTGNTIQLWEAFGINGDNTLKKRYSTISRKNNFKHGYLGAMDPNF